MLRFILFTTALIATSFGGSMVSLDLGTEFMKIGIVKPGVPIDIVLNTETKRKTPMAVYMKDGERLFGDAALSQGQKQPAYLYSHLLDLLGKTIDNPVVLEYQRRFPYLTIEGDPVRNTVVFRHGDSSFFSVEELLAMQVENAITMAVAHGSVPVDKVIICIPPFFNQVEREAVKSVAEIAGVQLMQLMSTTSAISLQYAVFRDIKMTEKPTIVLFATVGSQFTTAAVVSYSLQKDKNSKEKVPTVQVLGVGFDRSLGGYEMDLRLRELLADKFTEKYPKLPNVRQNARAMKKLLKEATKVKTVLSANTDTWAQVESLHKDRDFRAKVSRAEMEELFADLYPRVRAPVEEAIKSADITKMEIELVVPFGGASRVPKIQEEILAATEKKELHKYINTDEAAAMGSAFQAASTSSVYRTKEIKLKDANQYPITVSFNKITVNEEGGEVEEKLVNKELYHRNNAYPQKKAMTYTKFVTDFHFNVSYGEVAFLSDQQKSEFGSLPLMKVDVKGVQDVFNQHHDKNSKGIKAHILMDESGLVSVDSVEAIFETVVPVANDTESGWMDSVTNFFSGSGEKTEKEKAEDAGEEKKEEEKKEETKTDEKQNTTEKTEEKKDEEKKEEKPVVPEKPVIIKEKLALETTLSGVPALSETGPSRDKLLELKKVDDRKRATEEARNQLEAFVINMKDLITSDEYIDAGSSDEIEKIQTALSEETDWLEEESWGETLEVFNQRLATIEDYCDPLIARVKEAQGRPQAIADMKQAFNLTEQFLAKIYNTSEELRYHTPVELEKLSNLLKDTKEWLTTTTESQEALAANQDPVLKVADIVKKKQELERELYYLVKKPIPQWYREKLTKMMDALKKNTTVTEENTTEKEGEEKTEDTTAKTEEKTEEDNTETSAGESETPIETPEEKETETENEFVLEDKSGAGDAKSEDPKVEESGSKEDTDSETDEEEKDEL